jgi:hypothetical protein
MRTFSPSGVKSAAREDVVLVAPSISVAGPVPSRSSTYNSYWPGTTASERKSTRFSVGDAAKGTKRDVPAGAAVREIRVVPVPSGFMTVSSYWPADAASVVSRIREPSCVQPAVKTLPSSWRTWCPLPSGRTLARCSGLPAR